jgi:predicted aspartyl protease
MSTRCVCRNITFLLIFFPVLCIAGVTHWVDFELENGHIKIPVTVAGIEGKAILDTGAQLNGINKTFIRKHQLEFDKGKSVNVKGAYGNQKRVSYNNVPVILLGVDFSLDHLVETRLGHNSNVLLLGAGFFEKFIVQLDYPNKKMRLMTRDAIDIRKVENVRMESDKGSGLPIVWVRLNDEISDWLILDTGSNSGLALKRSTATSNGWLDKYKVKDGTSLGVNAMAFTQSFRLPTLKIGPYTLENVLTIDYKGGNLHIFAP